MSERPEDTPGFGWRVSLSIVASLGWAVFLIIWLFFYASAFNIYQNIAVFVASILVFGAIMGGSWASWGMKHGRKFEQQKYWEDAMREEFRKIVKEELENQKPKRPARRKR